MWFSPFLVLWIWGKEGKKIGKKKNYEWLNRQRLSNVGRNWKIEEEDEISNRRQGVEEWVNKRDNKRENKEIEEEER